MSHARHLFIFVCPTLGGDSELELELCNYATIQLGSWEGDNGDGRVEVAECKCGSKERQSDV